MNPDSCPRASGTRGSPRVRHPSDLGARPAAYMNLTSSPHCRQRSARTARSLTWTPWSRSARPLGPGCCWTPPKQWLVVVLSSFSGAGTGRVGRGVRRPAGARMQTSLRSRQSACPTAVSQVSPKLGCCIGGAAPTCDTGSTGRSVTARGRLGAGRAAPCRASVTAARGPLTVGLPAALAAWK